MTERRRGLVLLVLAGTTVLLLIAVALLLVEMFNSQGDAVARAQQQLTVYRALAAAHPHLQRELDAVNAQQTPTTALLQGDSTALAAASMQSLVKDLVERRGGQLRSAQTLPATTANGLEKIAVQYELSVPPGSLKSVTYELETAAPYLFIDAVEVRPEIYANNTAAPTALYVQWTVHGYRRAGAR